MIKNNTLAYGSIQLSFPSPSGRGRRVREYKFNSSIKRQITAKTAIYPLIPTFSLREKAYPSQFFRYLWGSLRF